MKVRFSAQADADIIECYLYGYLNFGRDQAERYEQGLRRAIGVIAHNPRISAERPEYTPSVRVHHHAKHYTIYLTERDHILVVRVLRDEVLGANDPTRRTCAASLDRHLGRRHTRQTDCKREIRAKGKPLFPLIGHRHFLAHKLLSQWA